MLSEVFCCLYAQSSMPVYTWEPPEAGNISKVKKIKYGILDAAKHSVAVSPKKQSRRKYYTLVF